MVNPWDVLPVAPEGDTDSVALYHAVGVALSAWEVLESAVAAIFADVVGSESQAAVAAYGTISSSPGRIDMVIAASEAADHTHINQAFLNELRPFLVNEVGKLSGRRNEIAHGTVTNFVGGPRAGHYLVPSSYNTRKRIPVRRLESGPIPFMLLKYAYTAAQVNEYGDHFWNYAKKANDFVDRLTSFRRQVEDDRRAGAEQSRQIASLVLSRALPTPDQ
jgi:hypothetical protein